MSHVTVENDNASDVPSSEPVEPGEPNPPAESHPGDEDTSLVDSIYLHLLSEHRHYDGLSLDEIDAAMLHAQLHHLGGHGLDHPIEDLSFRPKVALDNALYSGNKPADPLPSPAQQPDLPEPVNGPNVPSQLTPEHDDLSGGEDQAGQGETVEEKDDQVQDAPVTADTDEPVENPPPA